MLQIKRFLSFTECKTQWQSLEESNFHYPFQSWWYQNLFAKHFSQEEDIHILGIFYKEKLIAIGSFEAFKDSAIFLGTKDVSLTAHLEQDITDFGDILIHGEYKEKVAEIWETILSYWKNEKKVLDLRFVRQDSLTYAFFSQKNIHITQQETSPYITLPSSWDEYLSHLSRKDRHELKRKIKRFEEHAAFTFCTNQTVEEKFNTFIRLHKLSDPAKKKFMTKNMELFFDQLLTCEKNDWEVHICDAQLGGKTVASVMIFLNQSHMLLFNSGYDPLYRHLSVGLLLKAYLIKQAIEEKKTIYDFLRGDERYKYDLGAKDMLLYRIQTPDR